MDYVSGLFTIEEEKTNEIDAYLLEPLCPLNGNAAILQYWKQRKDNFPKLSMMARDYFAAPISSASIERRFSTSSHVLSKKRNRLKAENLEHLLCLHDWENFNKI